MVDQPGVPAEYAGWKTRSKDDSESMKMRSARKIRIGVTLAVMLFLVFGRNATQVEAATESVTTAQENAMPLKLRQEILQRYADLKVAQKLAQANTDGTDISDILRKYLPEGESFGAAAPLLTAAGFQLAPLPPRNVEPDSYTD
jgi:hypothetical protein